MDNNIELSLIQTPYKEFNIDILSNTSTGYFKSLYNHTDSLQYLGKTYIENPKTPSKDKNGNHYVGNASIERYTFKPLKKERSYVVIKKSGRGLSSYHGYVIVFI